MKAVGRTSWWRRLGGPALVVAALLAVSPGAAIAAEPGVPVPPSELLKNGNRGEVAEADEDFVKKVRLAGLWEIPAGEMAQEKSGNARIRDIGKNISAQHVVLDKLTRDAAAKLGIDLPNEPNADQQKWLGEMEDAEGTDFDQVYIDRLRAAHGKIFPAIATIRTSTRNDAVRKLAQQANQFVATHLTLLESSNLVDYQGLPTAPPPAPAAPAATGANNELAAQRNGAGGGGPAAATGASSLNLPVVLGVLVVALGVGAFLTRQTMSRGRSNYRRRRRY